MAASNLVVVQRIAQRQERVERETSSQVGHRAGITPHLTERPVDAVAGAALAPAFRTRDETGKRQGLVAIAEVDESRCIFLPAEVIFLSGPSRSKQPRGPIFQHDSDGEIILHGYTVSLDRPLAPEDCQPANALKNRRCEAAENGAQMSGILGSPTKAPPASPPSPDEAPEARITAAGGATPSVGPAANLCFSSD
jgi:hypothetical protein